MTHADELRTWAKGSYTDEAATELLIRGFRGRFAATGNPWVGNDDFSGTPWIDFSSIPEHAGGVSGREWRFLMFTASLAGNVPVTLGDVVPGVDRDTVQLMLAAVSHAAGSHEHSGMNQHEDGTTSFTRLSSLYPWPETPRQ
ncbi:hypothetical protein ABH924_003734 [Arthrobacter sp. GAS37]|uniref:hypothetical protein n=1 Tax=Arthrobacter sp. GAS37 TaxID=3156261 RepID=UPI003836DF51